VQQGSPNDHIIQVLGTKRMGGGAADTALVLLLTGAYSISRPLRMSLIDHP
jgi:hypothetical protein